MANGNNGNGAPATVRCAIYTRKSTDEGLNQDFNSLDAQRDAGEAYIRSQAGEGWTLLPDQYDDGGYTGANMDRPALRRLLADIQAKKVDCVVVYKVDRLSRSIRDFGCIMEILEKHGATFVSVTQQFNTTTSLGRLTLNILLSFAQFEREIISERTRDKQILARKRGMWTCEDEIPLKRPARQAAGRPKKTAAPAPPPIPRITRLMALAINFQDMINRGEVKDYADLARLGFVTRAGHADHESHAAGAVTLPRPPARKARTAPHARAPAAGPAAAAATRRAEAA